MIDGTNNSTVTVAAGTNPSGIAVNPLTNKIYVANQGSANVTVIDGTNNSTATITAGTNPFWTAVNKLTNKIYVGNVGSASVTVIDGTNNSMANVAVGAAPNGVALNQSTNKIYTANFNSGDVTVIDGTNNSATNIAAGTNPKAVAVNPLTNKIYIANNGSFNATVITPAPTNAIPLNTTVAPLGGNTTTNPMPTFTLTATSTYSPNAPPPQNIYFQVDTTNGTWTKAANTGSTATTLTATAMTPTLQNGIHYLYFYAADGSDATSINPARPVEDKFDKTFDVLAPDTSPIIGGINAYSFLVIPAGTTAASTTVGGHIVTAAGRGIARARVLMTDANGETRYALTNAFGYFRFENVEAGESYIVGVESKLYSFAPQVITISADITEINFIAQPERPPKRVEQ